MSSSYQASKTHVKFSAKKGSPKATKVVSSGTGNFVPSKSDCSKAGESMAGKAGKGFSGKGTC